MGNSKLDKAVKLLKCLDYVIENNSIYNQDQEFGVRIRKCPNEYEAGWCYDGKAFEFYGCGLDACIAIDIKELAAIVTVMKGIRDGKF